MEYKSVIKKATESKFDVDILMLTFQHAKYVEQALNGILAQKTEYKYHIVIFDDCSTDGTQEIIERYRATYSDRITTIVAGTNSNHQFRRELERELICSDYISYCEGDDYWTDPYKLQKQIVFLKQHPEYYAITGNVRNVDENGQLLHRDFNLYPYLEEHVYGKTNALRRQRLSHVSAIMCRNFYRELSKENYLKEFDCKANGDIKLFTTLGLLGNVYYSSDFYGDHRRVFTGNSWTASMVGKDTELISYHMWESITQYVKDVFGEDIEIETFRKRIETRQQSEDSYLNKLSLLKTNSNYVMSIMGLWIELLNKGFNLADSLYEKGFKTIIVYGLSYIGFQLCLELKSSEKVEILYGRDINSDIIIPGIKTVSHFPENETIPDAVIVTAITHYDSIKGNLEKEGYKNIIAFDDLLIEQKKHIQFMIDEKRYQEI